MNRFLTIILPCFLGAGTAFSQASIRDSSINMFQVKMSYSAQVPGGDLSQRFGFNSAIGLGVNYKMKNNFSFGIDGTFMFGTNVKEDVLANLKNSDGNIMDIEGNVAQVLVMERGFTLSGNAGWLMKFSKPNPNSGILFQAGAGFLQHKIRIEANRNFVPQVQGDYVKGYDRLSNGLFFSEFIAWHYLSNKRLINFFAGVECLQGFTRNRRAYNFDQGKADSALHTDLLFGIRAGWILLIYSRPPKEIY